MKKQKDYQVRDKWFYAVPSLFPFWPYKSRLALGIKLDDAKYRNASVFRFRVKETLYEIDAVKAGQLGKVYRMNGGVLPNLIPKEEFTVVKTDLPIQPEYDFIDGVAYLRIPKKMKEVQIQMQII